MLLFRLRFYKSRGLATEAVAKHGVRINGRRTAKASALVRVGDVLTFGRMRDIVTIKIATIPNRRGPAAEAGEHYHRLDDGGSCAPQENWA